MGLFERCKQHIVVEPTGLLVTEGIEFRSFCRGRCCAESVEGALEAMVVKWSDALEGDGRSRELRRRLKLAPREPSLIGKTIESGLVAAEPSLPPHSGYAALRRRVSGWIDAGLTRRSSAPWRG